MKILMVAPYDPRSASGHAGGVFLRTRLRELARLFEVTLVTWSQDPLPDGDFEGVRIIGTPIPSNRSSAGRLRDGLGPPSSFAGWLIAGAGRDHLNRSDLIEIQWPSAVGLLRRLRQEDRWPLAYVTHDLRSEALLSVARVSRKPVQRASAVAKLVRCAPQELRALRAADQIWCFRESEKRLIARVGSHAQVDVVSPTFPYVGTRPGSSESDTGDRVRLLCVADMSRAENKIAVDWFLRHVWPQICAGMPRLSLDIVGRCDDASYLAAHQRPGVQWRGWVDDLSAEYWASDVAIIPSNVRGGIKFKVAEALAYGVGVVSTQVGADGYPETISGIRRAKNPASWLSSIRELHAARRANPSVGAEYASSLASAYPQGRNADLAVARYSALVLDSE